MAPYYITQFSCPRLGQPWILLLHLLPVLGAGGVPLHWWPFLLSLAETKRCVKLCLYSFNSL